MDNKEISMEKTYAPQDIEQNIYQRWESSGAFRAERVPGKKPFTIVMPPPNITGQLHMGHAMDGVLQDSLTRYHRMKGDPTLWLPGTDHRRLVHGRFSKSRGVFLGEVRRVAGGRRRGATR